MRSASWCAGGNRGLSVPGLASWGFNGVMLSRCPGAENVLHGCVESLQMVFQTAEVESLRTHVLRLLAALREVIRYSFSQAGSAARVPELGHLARH